MVQGGDPTGTGRGGTSIFGDKFADEIHPELRFVGAGILAMANSGPNTNGACAEEEEREERKKLMTRIAILHNSRTNTVSRWQTHNIRAGEQWHEDNTTVGGGTDRRQRSAVGRYQNTSGEIRRGRWCRRTVGNTTMTIALHCQAVTTGSICGYANCPWPFQAHLRSRRFRFCSLSARPSHPRTRRRTPVAGRPSPQGSSYPPRRTELDPWPSSRSR